MKTKLIMVLVLLALVVSVASCGTIPPTPSALESAEVAITEPTDYGNGVYYFSGARNFGLSLSRFIAEHPDLKVQIIVGDGLGVYGMNHGFFVVFEER